MTNQQLERNVVGGVDTHKLIHHAAALEAATGQVLGNREFPATAAGYAQMLTWMLAFGALIKVGVEGTGSFGAGLQRHLESNQISVVEVIRPNRQERRARGKSDPLDAINAARSALSGTASTIPKGREGFVEAVRLIRSTRRSAARARRVAIQQIHAVLWCAPEELRERLAGYDRAALVSRCAKLRPATHLSLEDPAITARRMLRRLARRIQQLDGEIAEANDELALILREHVPTLMAAIGVGTEAAGQILTTAGENLDRLRSEAALARICGVAPIPASSGNTTRHRLHRGGDRAANSAIHLIVINRLRWHTPTRAYVAKRIAEGKTKKEIIRCLKRAVVRELFRALRNDLEITLDNA